MAPIVGRLAPSPTGAQHVGNARTYLIAWLAARAVGGQVRLRMEDIDIWRNKPDAEAMALDDLRWLGLDWDGEVLVQSTRQPEHVRALDRLRELELAYACTCSRSDIASAASAPHVEHESPVYPGTCAHRRGSKVPGVPHAWRFRVRSSPVFDDLVRGPIEVDPRRHGGDFVIWRAAAVPAYQLAVAVDDAFQGVTQVVRGDDLLSSTPRQMLILQALGMPVPQYAHVPLVVGADGRRLAKRHGDTRLVTLRERGIKPEKLIGLLAHSCGWIDESKPITARELINHFRWDSLPKTPFVFSEELLQ